MVVGRELFLSLEFSEQLLLLQLPIVTKLANDYCVASITRTLRGAEIKLPFGIPESRQVKLFSFCGVGFRPA